MNGDGRKVIGAGTLYGEKATYKLSDSYAEVILRGDISTCIGALEGASDIEVSLASLKCENAGEKALMLGGYNKNIRAKFNGVDIRGDIHNSLDVDCYAEEDDYSIENGRCRINVNDKPIERKLVYRF